MQQLIYFIEATRMYIIYIHNTYSAPAFQSTKVKCTRENIISWIPDAAEYILIYFFFVWHRFPVNTLKNYLWKGSICTLVGWLTIEIFSIRKSQSTNQNAHTSFIKVNSIWNAIHSYTTFFNAIYYNRSTKDVCEYILSGVGNSTIINKYF